jgi:hypothetical protein
MASPSLVRAINDEIAYTTATIANGASLSGAVDLGRYRLARIEMSAAWTAAAITFQVSRDGVTYYNLYDKTGTEYSVTTDASRGVIIPLTDFLGVQFLKVRSGTAGAAVNQAAERVLNLVLVP